MRRIPSICSALRRMSVSAGKKGRGRVFADLTPWGKPLLFHNQARCVAARASCVRPGGEFDEEVRGQG